MNFLELSKELCEKGVMYDKIEPLRNLMLSGPPNSERKAIWLQLTGAAWQIQDNTGYYQKLLETKKNVKTIATFQIDKDLGRTFATEKFFINKKNVNKLRNVLVTYSWRNETIGYCQGMSFITARLLTLGFNEEVTSMQEAFWILSQIIEKYMPFSYYTDMSGLILDMKVLEKTILKYLPKLSKKFLSIGLEPMLFSVQWFICIFSYNFSGPVVARLWDIFFIEGIGFIFKVALSILYLFRHKIMDIKGFEDGVIFCAHLAEQITDIDLILETTMRFDINIQEIDDLRNSLSNTNTQGVNYQQYCSNDRECKDLKRLTSDYLTFLCNTQVSIKDQYFDDESVPKYCDVGNINRYEDNFMLAVENHYCSKETPKQSFNKLLLQASNNHFSRKIAMPRISLSPYFLQSDIVEVAESLINN